VDAALWAWETFGGVGGRTRRGFGALQRIDKDRDLPARPADTATWLSEQLRRHVPAGDGLRDLPRLATKGVFAASLSLTSRPGVTPVPAGVWRYFIVQSDSWADGPAVWRYLIGRLRDFRQQRTGGRFGRSLWPEPDAIRRLTGKVTRLRVPTGLDRFPRAAFGLPIVFHFKDDTLGDPQETTLQGVPANAKQPHDRFASRLILRPLICADNRPVAVAVVLKGPLTPPGGLMLGENDKRRGPPQQWQPLDAKLEPNDAATVPAMRGQQDVLQAFLRSLV